LARVEPVSEHAEVSRPVDRGGRRRSRGLVTGPPEELWTTLKGAQRIR
jgi:hypothetical protein